MSSPDGPNPKDLEIDSVAPAGGGHGSPSATENGSSGKDQGASVTTTPAEPERDGDNQPAGEGISHKRGWFTYVRTTDFWIVLLLG
jgi:hypothetical protein